MDTLVITNQKGGVGKTTITALLGWWLAEKEKARVVLVDLDNQQNLSRTLRQYSCETGAARLFASAGTPVGEIAARELTLLPGETELANLDRASPDVIRNFRNNVAQLDQCYDYCLIDTPPTLGLRMIAALIVADYALCPIELEEYSIDGVTAMIKTVIGVRQRHNPRLKFLGLLANRFNPHSVRQREAVQLLFEKYGRYVIPGKISTRSAIPEALSEGVPVWKLTKTSAREAAAEVHKAFGVLRERMRSQAEATTELANVPS